MTNEELDAAVLESVRKEIHGWLPEDDAFCPTEYWSDCGPLVDMFDIDIGPHNGRWMAYCRLDVARSSVQYTAKSNLYGCRPHGFSCAEWIIG